MDFISAEPVEFSRQGLHSVNLKLIMRVSCIYTVLSFLAVGVFATHPTFSQTPGNRITKIGLENEPLAAVFAKIKEQTGLAIYYPGRVDEYENISLPIANRTVKQVLDLVLNGTDLTYRFKEDAIFIYEDAEEEKKLEDENSTPVNSFLITVTGKVTDAATQEPLAGVYIIVKGTTKGTTSDAEGKFAIEAEESEILVFSFVGFKIFETQVSNRSTIDVIMEADVTALKAVVVNGGYYETTDKLKTGSIVKITAKDIERQPVTSPLMALQGRVPGLEITPSSGAPGVAPKIRIRGTNSLRQGGTVGSLYEDGNYPLYVIDGVPVNSTPLNSFTPSFTNQGYDPLSTINPANIESIEVLKDGDATAIYGSRGANGVILITTKRGFESSDDTNVDISMYTGVGQVSKQMRVLNRTEYLTMRREALSYSELTPEEALAYDLYLWDTTRHTNWQKVLLGGNSRITDIQAGISAGTKNTSIRFSGGYHKETLVFPGDFGYYKLSGQLSIHHASRNQKFKISVSSTNGVDNSHFFVGNVMTAALTLQPNAPQLYNDDGSLNWEIHELPGSTSISTWVNPLSYFRMTQNAGTHNNISNVILSYDILPGFSLSTNAGYNNVSSNESSKTPRNSLSPTANVTGGSASFVDSKRMSWIVEPKVSYTKQIEKHKIDFMAGGTWQKNSNSLQVADGDEYASDALLGSLKGAGTIRIINSDVTEYRYNSVFARLAYNWREKYLLNLTGRRDGSSRFGPGNRFGNFGSIGAAWIFSEENFIQRVMPFMNFGKFRASYGITGSDNIGDYNYYNFYTIADHKYGGLMSISPYALYNLDYAWEVTRKLEAVLELSFVQNRIGLEISWYRNRSSNQLVNYPLSDVTGFPSVLSNFDATIQNSGWEAVVRGDLLNSDSWRWNISINCSLPSNKLVKFDGIEDSPYATIYKVGEPLSAKWLYTWKGVNNETGVHDFVDENEDGLLTDLDRTIQNLTGTVYYGGISNTVQYKNLEISFLFQFSHQQSPRYMPGMPGIDKNQPVDVLNRWQNNNDETDVQRFSHISTSKSGVPDAYVKYNLLPLSNYNSIDASFIRLKTFSIGYRLSNRWLEMARVKEIKTFLQAQNLLTFTDYEGLDPETGSGLPPLRMVTAGVQLKF